MAKPLAGCTVVVTRSVAQNRMLCERLREVGAVGLEVPLIEVQPPRCGLEPLSSALDRIEDFHWLVLTSANGVEAVARARPPLAPWPSRVQVAVVGPATRTAAEAAGLPVHLMPTIATAQSLVEAFPVATAQNHDRVLAPLAELAGATVQDGLAAKGYRVERVDAYRTEPPPAAVSEPIRRAEVSVVANADAVLFYSPSAVNRFVDRFASGGRPSLAVCIGPSTALQAERYDEWLVITANPHDDHGVISALVKQLSES